MPKMPDLSKPFVSTTIKIRTALWKKIKQDSVKNGQYMRDYISEILEEHMKNVKV
jgi:hypothetical protein